MNLQEYELELLEDVLEHLRGMPRARSDFPAATHREALVREVHGFQGYGAQMSADRREALERVAFRLAKHVFIWATIRARLDPFFETAEPAQVSPR